MGVESLDFVKGDRLRSQVDSILVSERDAFFE